MTVSCYAFVQTRFAIYLFIIFNRIESLVFTNNEDIQRFTIEENQQENTFVGRVKYPSAFDGKVTFFFSQISEMFAIDFRTGDITNRKVLDLESLCPKHCPEKEYASIYLSVNVNRDNALQAIIKILIVILDVDDNSPTFPSKNVVIEIKEVVYTKNKVIGLPAATDRDILLKNRQISYRIFGDHSDFILEDSQYQVPKLRLLTDIDYERTSEYHFVLCAFSQHEMKNSANVSVTLKVININDCAPEFERSMYEVSIQEDFEVNSIVIQITANDTDGDVLNYTLTPPSNIFKIKSFGRIYLSEKLDYEREQEYNFQVQANDDSFKAETKLKITIVDVNDEAPYFILTPFKLTVNESAKAGSFVGQISISDRDSLPVNRGIKCSEPSHDMQPLKFQLEKPNSEMTLTYSLYTTKPLDREQLTNDVVYSNIVCYDNGLQRQLYSNISVPLYVNDVNDNAPFFKSSQYETSVKENNDIGYQFYRVEAQDKDSGINGQVTYNLRPSVDSSFFQINAQTGWIKIMQSLDRETKDRYSLIIIATDHGLEKKTGSTTLLIRVLDENDNAPQLINPNNLSIRENQPIGTYIGTFEAVDKDEGENAKIKFELSTNGFYQPFSINRSGSLFTTEVFDREKREKVCAQIQISDSSQINSLTSHSPICVKILDENDNYPKIVLYDADQITRINPVSNTTYLHYSNIDYVLQMSVREEKGFVLAYVNATDDDIDSNGMLSYYLEYMEDNSFLQAAFEIDPRTGQIKVSRPLQRDFIGSHRLKIIVEDSGMPVLKTAKNMVLEIVDIPPYTRRFKSSTKSREEETSFIGNNLLIAVVLSIVSALLILLLIIAILCIVRPCFRNERFRNNSYHSNLVPSLMFQDQERNFSPDIEKPHFEISGNVSDIWGNNTLKSNSTRLGYDQNWPNVMPVRPSNDIYLESFFKSPDNSDYQTSNSSYCPLNAGTMPIRLFLRNDEQRSDSGKGASDDDTTYLSRFINEPVNISMNDFTGSLTYSIANSVQIKSLSPYLFNYQNDHNLSTSYSTQNLQSDTTAVPYHSFSVQSTANI